MKYLPFVLLLIAGVLDLATTYYGLGLNGRLVWEIDGDGGRYPAKVKVWEKSPLGVVPFGATILFSVVVFIINLDALNQHKISRLVSTVMTAGIVMVSFHPALANGLIILDILERLV